MSSRSRTSDAVEILRDRYLKANPERQARVAAFREQMEVARQIYELRTSAGLTQKQLAERVGTRPSAISRLENADYEGHSLAMLRRIAAALGKRVVVSFEDVDSEPGRVPAEPEPAVSA